MIVALIRSRKFFAPAILIALTLPACGNAASDGNETVIDNANSLLQEENHGGAKESASSLQGYIKDTRYVIYDIDVDGDGVSDKIVSSKKNAGNELLFFVRHNSAYTLRLRSINLTEDGGRVLGGIRQEHSKKKDGDVLSIETYFPQGHDIAKHYISYINEHWILSRTVYEVADWRDKSDAIYICEVEQGIPMELLVSESVASQLHQLPDEPLRQKECRIKDTSK